MERLIYGQGRTESLFGTTRCQGGKSRSSAAHQTTTHRAGPQGREGKSGESQEKEESMKRPRETGSILRMKGSTALWIKYHRNGKPVRESAHTTKVKEAEKLLRVRLATISTGTYVGPKLEKVRISELADDLIREYRINGRKSIDDLKARWDLPLKPFFGVLRAVEMTSQLVAHYIDAR